jgi:hypothetical protein
MKKDETFWPCFVAEVRNENEEDWRVIGESTELQGVSTRALEPSSELQLHADMDIFRPMIGKVNYGRFRFSNGVWTMFDLKLLADD